MHSQTFLDVCHVDPKQRLKMIRFTRNEAHDHLFVCRHGGEGSAVVNVSDEEGHYDIDGVSLACDQVIVGSSAANIQCVDSRYLPFFNGKSTYENVDDRASRE